MKKHLLELVSEVDRLKSIYDVIGAKLDADPLNCNLEEESDIAYDEYWHAAERLADAITNYAPDIPKQYAFKIAVGSRRKISELVA